MQICGLLRNIKIAAVRSLADICFLHVLYFLLCYSIRCFSYAIRVNWVHILNNDWMRLSMIS